RIVRLVSLGIGRMGRILGLVCEVAACRFLVLFTAAAATAAGIFVLLDLLLLLDRHRNIIDKDRVKEVVVYSADLQVTAKNAVGKTEYASEEHYAESAQQQRVALLDILFLDDCDIESALGNGLFVLGLERIRGR